MYLHELITENSQNGNDLNNKNHTSNALGGECADGKIERSQREKETQMPESVAK